MARSHNSSPTASAKTSSPVIVACVIACASVAPAQVRADDVYERAAALDRAGSLAEREADPARALTSYRFLVASTPRTRWHRRAERRIAWIQARSEGGFAPLAALMEMQRLSRRELTIARLRGFERKVRLFPEGIVRRESRALLAEAWLRRFGRAREGLLAHEAWLIEPGLRPGERHRAAWGAAQARVALGDARTALARWNEMGIDAPVERAWLRAAAVAQTGRPIAWAVIVLFVVVSLGLGRRELLGRSALRRAFSAPRLGAASWAGVVPVLIAWQYDSSLLGRFACTAAAAMAPVATCSWVAAAQSERGAGRGERWALAVVTVLAVLGAGFLVTERFGALSWWLQ